MVDGLIDILLMLVILVILVVAHEFGHFALARRAGVTVHEFGIGFPPRIRTIGHLWGTPITLNALPLGGFVRLEDENGDAAEARQQDVGDGTTGTTGEPTDGSGASATFTAPDPGSFAAKSLPTRVGILLGGVAMNALVAVVIFTALAMAGYPSTTIRIGAYSVGTDPATSTPSPAQLAGLKTDTQVDANTWLPTGDTILAIDGQRFVYFDGPDPMLAYLKSHAGRTVSLAIRHENGTEATVSLTLRDPAHAATEGALGIKGYTPVAGPAIQASPLEAVGLGINRTVTTGTQIFAALGTFIADIAHPQVAGPIGIAEAVGQTRSSDAAPLSLPYLVALLSANLAILNVLPLPPMDGGRIATSLIRAVGRGRVGIRFERRAALVGFALLIALVFWVGANDIARLQG